MTPTTSTIPAPLDPPAWATRTVTDADGITHERAATTRSTVRINIGVGWIVVPADASLSSTDTLDETGWHRTNPTIVIEGGNYPLQGARQLCDALAELLAIIDTGSNHPTRP
jgi:hypothetical protein